MASIWKPWLLLTLLASPLIKSTIENIPSSCEENTIAFCMPYVVFNFNPRSDSVTSGRILPRTFSFSRRRLWCGGGGGAALKVVLSVKVGSVESLQ